MRKLFQRHDAGLLVAAWSPDGEKILTGAADGTAWIRRTDGRGAPRVLSGHAGPVLQATWSPDGSSSPPRPGMARLRVWPADGRGAPILLSGHQGPVSGVSFSPAGERLVTSSADHTAGIWQYRLELPELRHLAELVYTRTGGDDGRDQPGKDENMSRHRADPDAFSGRVTIDPEICHGKPCIRGLRYPVELILELLSAGMTSQEILADYEDLEEEDILAALAFAVRLSQVKRLQPWFRPEISRIRS